MDQNGIEILAHMRVLTLARIEGLQQSLFHLEDSLPILVAEYERMISEHKAALQYETDVLRRQDAHMQGALYAAPGQAGLQTQAFLPPQAPIQPSNNLEIIHSGPPVQGGPPALQGFPMPYPSQGGSGQQMVPQLAVPSAQSVPFAVPVVPMTNDLALAAQAHVGASSAKFGAQIRAAAPLPQSVVKAVMYEPGESRPPEALPGHMDPSGPEPRTAEELLAARDAERSSHPAG